MIKLVVAPYCDDCMHFKPKAKTTCHYTLDNRETLWRYERRMRNG